MSDHKTDHLNADELAEQASLAALDFLTASEAAAIPPAMVEQEREAAALLGAQVAPIAPPAGLRARLMNRLADHEALKPASEVRSFDGGWRASGLKGIDFKPLYHDRKSGMYTNLVRMQPGAEYPTHVHYDDEQCLVIEGDVRWGDSRYLKGDFVATKAGIIHPTLETDGGNLLLIISGHNEFLHA